MARAPKNRIETQRLIRYVIWKAMNKKATDDDDDDGGDGDDEEGEKEKNKTPKRAHLPAHRIRIRKATTTASTVCRRVCVSVCFLQFIMPHTLP